MSTHCTATKPDGTPCRAWAVRGSDPPLCSAHGGGRAPVGAPAGNRNAATHGFYAGQPLPEPAIIPEDINAVIHDLAVKQARLSKYINGNLDKLDTLTVLRLLQLHAQTASRLGRLLRDQRALTDQDIDELTNALSSTLDAMGQELGIQL